MNWLLMKPTTDLLSNYIALKRAVIEAAEINRDIRDGKGKKPAWMKLANDKAAGSIVE